MGFEIPKLKLWDFLWIFQDSSGFSCIYPIPPLLTATVWPRQSEAINLGFFRGCKQHCTGTRGPTYIVHMAWHNTPTFRLPIWGFPYSKCCEKIKKQIWIWISDKFQQVSTSFIKFRTKSLDKFLEFLTSLKNRFWSILCMFWIGYVFQWLHVSKRIYSN